jgi:septal ring factor EnvC (AmiA/AmiB activator)
VGATVAASEVIAEVGDTGSVEGSLLYLEIRRGRTPLDPARWLRPDP